MNICTSLILPAIIGYFIGSVNFALVFSFICKKQDIRHYGSTNAGMTNTMRVYGFLAGILVFIGDFTKGIITIYLFHLLFSNYSLYNKYGYLIASLTIIIGHLYPIYFKFRGGKGVATSAGIILAQDIRLFIIFFSVFITVLLLSKIVSLASITSIISYPIATIIFFKSYALIIFSIIISALIVFAHRKNITRLINHTEVKIFK